jgi:uncharacterized protein (DUF433 family)
MADVVRQHITKAPGVCGGRACIAGHRIRVMDIVVLHEMRGLSRDELVQTFPGLTPADIHAALAYFFEHVSEIQEEYRGDQATLKMLLTCPPAELRTRLGEGPSSGVVAAAAQDAIRTHITKTPGVCGGRACIAGHRIRVMDIVAWHEMPGCSADEVVDMFPGITPADVHDALAYYFDNREEIEADFRKDEEWAKFAEANFPSQLREKLPQTATP